MISPLVFKDIFASCGPCQTHFLYAGLHITLTHFQKIKKTISVAKGLHIYIHCIYKT